MKAAHLLLLFATLQFPNSLISQNFQTRGIGGGGALFSPSINPNNGSENYLASDLGGLYYTADGNYDVVHFTAAVTGPFGKVCFTQTNGLRYALLYDAEHFTTRPARTLSGGINWDFMPGDADPSEDKLFIFCDYQNPNRVIWTDYNHLFLSNDGGQTASLKWTAANSGTGILLSGAFFEGEKIWLGTNEGILFSANGGNSFSLANFSGIPSGEVIIGFGGGKSGNLTRFYALTGDPDNVWASSMGFNYWETIRGVYTMENTSGTWASKTNGIDLSKDFAVFLAMADNDPNTCYLAGSTPNETAIVLKTTNGGDAWQHVFLTQNNQNIFTGYSGDGGDLGWSWGGNALGFTVNPHNSQQAIMTDFGFMHQTTNGGQTWHQGYLSGADENPAGSPTPKKKKYHGIGLEQTTCWQIYWFDEQTMFGCFTDIKGVRSEDGGNTWSFDYTGHDQNTMYRIAKHNTMPLWFAATSSVHDIYQTTYVTDARLQPSYKAGKVLYTSDKGKTWQTMHDFGNPVIWVTPDASNNDRIYASVISTNHSIGGVWRADGISNPATATWTKLPNPPANNGRIFNIHSLNDGTLVTTWSARKSNSGSVFSDSSGVFVSTNGGQSWERRNHPDMNYWTKDLVVDPNDALQNTWYACVWSGWGGPANDIGGLFRTKDRGLNWEKITGDGQFLRVSSVALTNSGTFLTTEGEGLWQAQSSDISNGQPTWNLAWSYPFHHPERVFENPNQNTFNKYLWIASFGNGMRSAYTGETGTSNPAGLPSATMRSLQNPASGNIEIELDLKKAASAQFRLLNMQGRLVQDFSTYNLVAGQQLLSFPVKDLPGGAYLLRMVLASGEILALKLVMVE
ncbi:MAG: hypothetical protein K9J37_00245 [Saprospiraceae bacterium]|nr:hypothetical protein [Saprospiraceae bacterium]MCF8248302.1 hypothetical protein [Saprospiraceae bacterium]MCF8279944.1 hypothetical protein [Bacteroidales bacterium]MCF8309830.1 hypothetical protein [Saprospiraceae bacterium]MCF8438839.1 hypothetical protein [Saprospiraceae bacterium]